jgi:ATP synthase proteolipid subunit
MGASLCMILSSWGSAWGTWRAGLGVCHMGVDHPAGIIKNIVPIVMAGVLGIYGLIVAVIITQAVVPPSAGFGNTYSMYNGYTHVRLLFRSFFRSWSFVLKFHCFPILQFYDYCIFPLTITHSPFKMIFLLNTARRRSLLRIVMLGGGWNDWNIG